jgi:hypothetical protein
MKSLALAFGFAGAAIAASLNGCGSSTITPTTVFELQAEGGGVDGQFVTFLHEGAGMSYGFIDGTSGQQFNLSDGSLLANGLVTSGIQWSAHIDAAYPVVEIGPGVYPTDHFAILGSDILSYNSSTTFFSCTNITSNPYNYAGPALAFGDSVGDCTEIKVHIVIQ